MYISSLKKQLLNDGFVHIKSFFNKDEVLEIEKSIDSVYQNPTLFKIKKEIPNGEFFMDYNNWRRNKLIEKICKSDKIVAFITELTNSKKCWLMHEDVIIKKGNAPKTPIHHDRPYFIFKGDLNLTVWTSVNDISAKSSLILYKNSHKIDTLFLPKTFATNKNSELKLEGKSNYTDIDSYDFKQSDETKFDYKLGDIIIFFNRTVHRAPEHFDNNTRKSLAVRYLLDGSTLTENFYNDVPPYTKIGVKVREDAPVPEKFFPLLKG